MINFSNPEPDYPIPDYLFEGQEVIIAYREADKFYGMRCKVIKATGDYGLVENKKYGVLKWVDRYDMRIKHE